MDANCHIVSLSPALHITIVGLTAFMLQFIDKLINHSCCTQCLLTYARTAARLSLLLRFMQVVNASTGLRSIQLVMTVRAHSAQSVCKSNQH